MNTNVVTVRYVNPAKAGARSGSIKDMEDIYYSVPKDMLGQFQANGTYEIDWKQNGNFKNVSAVRPVAGASENPGPVGAAPQAIRQRAHPQDSANMWAHGMMVAMIAANKVELEEMSLYEAEIMIRRAHHMVATELRKPVEAAPQAAAPTPAPRPTRQQEMDDEIPF